LWDTIGSPFRSPFDVSFLHHIFCLIFAPNFITHTNILLAGHAEGQLEANESEEAKDKSPPNKSENVPAWIWDDCRNRRNDLVTPETTRWSWEERASEERLDDALEKSNLVREKTSPNQNY
jgi:hypothetical protein